MSSPNIREIVEVTLKNFQHHNKGRYSFSDKQGQCVADKCVPVIETKINNAMIDIIEAELEKQLVPYLTAKGKGTS